ncbi:TetR family transcriptional regulator [Candidimonas humi]|uniref:TetR/AcrR family transcriptional regulator n=1 Tax=Candidimonas humi TaxID=683355 RepID=A0ABV8P3L8_9BURK|nr:TetR family transcriptional regulator [Candidimonas humi]
MDTKQKIIQTALTLFARHGFNGTTLKDITASAGVNVAAIHYHIGGKEELIRAVLASVVEPVNRMRREALQKLNAGPGPTLRCVVEALVAPPIRHSLDATGDSRLLVRLLMQARTLPSQTSNAAIFRLYDELALEFVEAFLKASPGLGREEAFWRYAFTIGSMMYIITDSDKHYHRLNRLSGGLCDTDDPQAIIGQLATFVVAGIQAANIAPDKGASLGSQDH